jgi:hypothetical protein
VDYFPMKNKMNFIFRLVVAALSLFPPKIQQVFYKTSSLDTHSIDLKVHPHSIWVAYPIINETEILEHLPPDLELTPIRVFQTLPSQKLVFFNFFTVDASTVSPMGGHRLEIMTVVREKTTGKKRFLLLETFKNSNMNIFNHQNKIACNLDNRYSVVGKIRDDPSIKILSSEFAIGCNKKIYHSNHFPHVLTFDENKIKIVKLFSNILVLNTLWESCRAKEPVFSFYYPSSLVFSKHIAPGSFHQEKNQEQNYEDFDIPSLMFLFNDACFL